MKTLLFLLFFCCFEFSINSQINQNNTKWMEYLEELTGEDTDVNLVENLYTDLSYLSEHPFDLHTATKKDLERLPFLSDLQVENILYYVYKYAPLQTIYELRNVEGLDLLTIEYLLPFVYVGKKEIQEEKLISKKTFKYAKQELLLRYDQCLQEKAGYERVGEEERQLHPNKYYLGEDYYLSLRYGFQYKNRIQAGLIAEKDPGEAFWNGNHKGFDYYSAHLVLRDIGVMKALYLGDYRLSFGQGLVLNTDFVLGKTSDVVNVSKKSNGIKRHSSTSESNFFRGSAITLGIKKFDLNLFYSQKKSDATADDSTIFTFKTDGYRRTNKDLEKKNQAEIRLGGMNFQWKNEFLNVGFTAIYYDFDNKKLFTDAKPYNIYYLRGYSNYNAGLNYLYRRKNFNFQGETAISENGALATLNILQLSPSSAIRFVLLHRYYAKNYQSQFAASFSEGSTVQNESGYYVGMTLNPFKYWKISASADFFNFPWLKYGVDAPSSGNEALLRIDYTPKSKINMNLRYKRKEKEKNMAIPGKHSVAVLAYQQHNFNYGFNYQTRTGLNLKTQINANLYINPDQTQRFGKIFSQNIGYDPVKIPLKGDIYFAYFNTNDWNSRVTAYEKNILYAFNYPSFYGEGLRFCTTLKYDMTKNLTYNMKFAWTHYLDHDQISSGLELIEGKDKMDVYCLVRWKF